MLTTVAGHHLDFPGRATTPIGPMENVIVAAVCMSGTAATVSVLCLLYFAHFVDCVSFP